MTLLDRIVPLFAYPDAGYAARAGEAAQVLGLDAMRVFADTVRAMPGAELQERFVEAFDLDPDCSPDLGWHLFGERYERGEWLARLRADLVRLEIGPSPELPDHLTNLLKILARDERPRVDALARCIAPALEKLHAGLERRASPFRHAVAAVQHIVAASASSGTGDGDV